MIYITRGGGASIEKEKYILNHISLRLQPASVAHVHKIYLVEEIAHDYGLLARAPYNEKRVISASPVL